MKEQIENLLPAIKRGEVPKEQLQTFANYLRNAIKENPEQGKELGPLFSLVNAALKAEPEKADLNWVPILNGFLAIGHKPGGKISFAGMAKSGGTAVLTLLQENEGAAEIGRQVTTHNLNWLWFPFSASKPPAHDEIKLVFDLYQQVEKLLQTGQRIYIHCSAGIHRTGMVTYGLLRYLSKSEPEARQILLKLREVTAAQVGEDRLVWGDQFARE